MNPECGGNVIYFCPSSTNGARKSLSKIYILVHPHLFLTLPSSLITPFYTRYRDERTARNSANEDRLNKTFKTTANSSKHLLSAKLFVSHSEFFSRSPAASFHLPAPRLLLGFGFPSMLIHRPYPLTLRRVVPCLRQPFLTA